MIMIHGSSILWKEEGSYGVTDHTQYNVQMGKT